MIFVPNCCWVAEKILWKIWCWWRVLWQMTDRRKEIKKQSHWIIKIWRFKITKKLEIKQVKFKLGEDCWDMKYQSASGCQSTAAWRTKVKVLLKNKVKVLLIWRLLKVLRRMQGLMCNIRQGLMCNIKRIF